MSPSFYPYLLSLVAISLITRLVYNKFGHGINHVPGPWIAAYTDLWRLWVVWHRRPELTHIALHKKYGKTVRLGPKTVSISDPEAIKSDLCIEHGFCEGFYPVQQTIARGKALHSIFNTTDEKFHAQFRRMVANAYAMSTLVQFEPLVDSTSRAFLAQMESRYADRSDESGICDFGTWLQFYAFDVIGELTYSKRLGFLDQGIDVDSIISNLEWVFDYVAVIGQIPILDRFFLKNPLRLWFSKLGLINTTSPVVLFARQRMADREVTNNKQEKSSQRDFLSHFLTVHQKNPDFMNRERVLASTVTNMIAGSDTTAITLRAVFYFLLRSPSAMRKLLDELDQLEDTDFPLVKWNQVCDLPYLSAVIKEALRCHPAVGLALERIVPPAGVTIAGEYFPPGIIVGCSAWTIHYDEGLFGRDVETFRPERWIEASKEKKIEMNKFQFAFGAGARTCIGKNISLLEMYKLVPAVLKRFEISLAHPEKEWKLHNAWFVKQSEFYVRLRTRKRSDTTKTATYSTIPTNPE